MIKFFRKIRQKILSENRFSKYLIYAIGEIVLVVIGILIALQINNWNEHRKTKQKEETVLNTLLADLEKNKVRISETREANLKLQDLSKTWIEMMNPDTADVKWSPMLDSVLFWGMDYYVSEFILSSSNAPMTQSSLELISNDSLRRLVVDYPNYIGLYKDKEQEVRRIVIEHLRPIGESHISLNKLYDGKTKFKSDYTALLKDRQLNNDFINKIWQTDEMLVFLNGLEKATDELITNIQSEIKK